MGANRGALYRDSRCAETAMGADSGAAQPIAGGGGGDRFVYLLCVCQPVLFKRPAERRTVGVRGG